MEGGVLPYIFRSDRIFGSFFKQSPLPLHSHTCHMLYSVLMDNVKREKEGKGLKQHWGNKGWEERAPKSHTGLAVLPDSNTLIEISVAKTLCTI